MNFFKGLRKMNFKRTKLKDTKNLRNRKITD